MFCWIFVPEIDFYRITYASIKFSFDSYFRKLCFCLDWKMPLLYDLVAQGITPFSIAMAPKFWLPKRWISNWNLVILKYFFKLNEDGRVVFLLFLDKKRIRVKEFKNGKIKKEQWSWKRWLVECLKWMQLNKMWRAECIWRLF